MKQTRKGRAAQRRFDQMPDPIKSAMDANSRSYEAEIFCNTAEWRTRHGLQSVQQAVRDYRDAPYHVNMALWFGRNVLNFNSSGFTRYDSFVYFVEAPEPDPARQYLMELAPSFAKGEFAKGQP